MLAGGLSCNHAERASEQARRAPWQKPIVTEREESAGGSAIEGRQR
uniref:Uncharacterized protein n=1 Tax=Myoviridae sp. ctPkm1 TaxID=2825099 RepID=A0A8S5TYH8_9CAUD|nr:MAG TPA: hypothetical protein [Myoviridae sp. ctPkm1]